MEERQNGAIKMLKESKKDYKLQERKLSEHVILDNGSGKVIFHRTACRHLIMEVKEECDLYYLSL